jgi:AGZA family xanthine/uracil permease-like MFS transporter
MLERFFKLKEHQTSVPQETIAGLTTFAAMAYILAVNPLILSTTGMDKGALVTATGVASAVMTIVMALATNYPIALAPGMGLNAFFAFTICGAKGVPWTAALGLVFYSGLIFMALSVSGLRQKLVEAIPMGSSLPLQPASVSSSHLLDSKTEGLSSPIRPHLFRSATYQNQARFW